MKIITISMQLGLISKIQIRDRIIKFHVDKGEKLFSVEEYIKIINIQFVLNSNLNLIKESMKFVARYYKYIIFHRISFTLKTRLLCFMID